MQRYTFVWGDWGAHFSLEEFLTTRAITSWRKLISIIDSEGEHCKYADSIRNFAEPVTGNLGEIPIILFSVLPTY